jgi:hypothetical protein
VIVISGSGSGCASLLWDGYSPESDIGVGGRDDEDVCVFETEVAV